MTMTTMWSPNTRANGQLGP